MKTLYFDCFSGAGGDMIVAALIDLGVSIELLRSRLAKLNLSGYGVGTERVSKRGLAATRFVVDVDVSVHTDHRHLSDIRRIVEGADLPERVVRRIMQAFERLAEAEAEVHGINVERVHFHEVGAVDSIVDIAGAMIALEELDVGVIQASALAVGGGTVTCDHGVLPVPAPATAILLKGVPLAAGEEAGELLTPTAAAVLTTVCGGFGPMPAMTLERVGMGAGTRELAGRPNVLRAMLGRTGDTAERDEVVVLEANVDDASPQWIGRCMQRLLDEGAMDAYCTPIYMKKGRPGVVLAAVCAPADVARMEGIIFAETTTFGIRRHRAERSKLDRRWETVETAYGPIRVKVGLRQGQTMAASPEYEDCAAVAERQGVAVREVMAAAMRAWQGTAGD